MHSKSLVTALTVVAAVVGVALAAPKDDVHEMNNEIIPSGVVVSKNGESASASWGGFHASAALADDGSAVASAGGNGLGAGAGYGVGGAGAGAGLYGTGAAASSDGVPSKPASGGYGNGGKPGSAGGPPPLYFHQGGPGNGFFDRIFAIPINVLQSVNTYLNQKQSHQGQPGSHAHHVVHGGASASSASASAGGINTAAYGADKAPADYGHGGAAAASEHGKPGAPMMIPITALRSVQNLLNG